MSSECLDFFADDVAKLINTYSRAVALQPNSRYTPEQLHQIRRSQHHGSRGSKGTIPDCTEESSRETQIASEDDIRPLAAELQILKEAIQDPLYTINALFSIHILRSFDDPLLTLLNPVQCAQLLEIISLAGVATELEKQLQALRKTMIEHGREDDLHLALVRDIKGNFVEVDARIQAFAAQHIESRSTTQEPTIVSPTHFGNLLMSDLCIQRMYSGLQGGAADVERLVSEQDSVVFAMKLFLEEKLEIIRQKRYSPPNSDETGGIRNGLGHSNNWPSATIPAAQLSTTLLSSMLAHLTSCSHEHCLQQSQPPMSEPPTENLSQLQPTSDPTHPIEDQPISKGKEILTTLDSKDIEDSDTPIQTSAARVAPHVRFELPKLLDKRRDSAISLLSSIGKPECTEVHEDESLPGEEIDSGEENTEDVRTSEAGCSLDVVRTDSDDEAEEKTADDGQELEPEIAVDAQMRPQTTDIEPSSTELVEDLYSADDQILPIGPQIPEAEEEIPSIAAPAQPLSCSSILAPRTTPFLSSHWPQRAWLQSILSMVNPDSQQSTTPLSPSFPSETLASPPPNTSSSDWYSGYDAWWSFAMRGSHENEDHDNTEAESTTTATSERSWGAGSRSTEADSIDS